MKIKYFTLPNILTLANLLCGVFASLTTVASIWDPSISLAVPLLFILASALFDFLDGFAARLTGQYSPLGVQLDSLADMVSFGLTPSLILVALYNNAGGVGWWWLLALGVVLCSALRLARFNIDEEQRDSFIGLPTPALAIAVGSLAWAVEAGDLTLSPSVLLAISIVGAWLLISPIRMFSFKFKSFAIGENAVRFGFLAFALTIVIIGGLSALWCAIAAYIAISLILQLTTKKERN
jgi:CDP-diacylglycerol--serine O-phosphatidyltransferase